MNIDALLAAIDQLPFSRAVLVHEHLAAHLYRLEMTAARDRISREVPPFTCPELEAAARRFHEYFSDN